MMRIFTPLVLCLLVILAQPARADADGVRCVQGQLAAAGFDPGPVDGLLGRQTMRAYRAYIARFGLAARAPLEPGNAVTWCRRIGLGDDRLRRFWPSARSPLNLVFASGVDDTVRTVLQEWLPRSHARATELLGLDIAGTDTVIVGTSLAELEQLVPRYLPERVRWSRLGEALRAQCDNPRQFGAFTVPGITVICVPPDTATGYRLPPADLYDAAAHEALHLIARQILGIYPDSATEEQRPEIDGPKWFHEGVAMVFAETLVTGRVGGEIRRDFRDRLGRRPMMPLQELETREAVQDNNDQVYLAGGIAASFLVQEHGFPAVGQMFDLMGQGVRFPEAFERQFNQPLEDFYRRFSAGGSPFPAARDRDARAERPAGTRAVPPDLSLGIEVLIAPDVDPGVATEFRTRLPVLFDRVVAMLGVEPRQAARFFVASAPDAMRALLSETTGRAPRSGQEAWIGDTCAGARIAASLTGTWESLVCARPGFAMTDDRAAERLEAVMIRMVARQIYHLVVGPASNGLSGNARRYAEGPLWLREGIITVIGRTGFDPVSGPGFRAGILRRYEDTPLPALRDQEIRGDATAERAVLNDLGAIAVSFLVDEFGMDGVGRWISLIGRATPYAMAFEETFGQSLDAFYASLDLRLGTQPSPPVAARRREASANIRSR